MLQATEALSLIEARLAGLVHPSVEDGPARPAHERFIVARMVSGFLGLAALPAYLLFRGTPSVIEGAVALCAAGPAIAGLVAMRTGRLVPAQAIASASLAGLAVCLAVSGPLFLVPALILLAAVPCEALLSGSRRATALAAALALAAGLAAIILATRLPLPPDAWAPSLALSVLAWLGLAQLAGHVFVQAGTVVGAGSIARAVAAHENSLLQAIDDLVTWHDAGGSVVRAGAGSARLLGVPGSSLKDQGLLRHVHVSDRPEFLRAVSEAAHSDVPVVAQFRLHTGRPAAGGLGHEVIWAELRAHRTCTGAEHAVVAVTRDVTAHRRHAEELDIARAKAEQADGAKGRFLATVSHELRTPLNAIIGFSEVMVGEIGQTMSLERARDYAGIIHESGEHLLAVVNTLLDMSKIEAGAFDFAPEPFDVAHVVQGCCDLMQLKAEEGGLVLERGISARLPEVVADRRAVRQIVINLLSNALKFTPAGGRVTVQADRRGDRLLLRVGDTGIGIPDGDLPRIGDPFFQSGACYDRRHEGTGLGLSVVRGLVGLHGGTLALESAPGEGTLVSVSLPLDCRTGGMRTQPVTVRASARTARPNPSVLRKSA